MPLIKAAEPTDRGCGLSNVAKRPRLHPVCTSQSKCALVWTSMGSFGGSSGKAP